MTDFPQSHIKNVDDIAMPIQAVIWALLTFLLFAIMDTGVKFLVTNGINAKMIVWVRFTTQFLFFFCVYKAWNSAAPWSMQKPAQQIARAILLPLCTILNFSALKYLQLDQTMTVFLSVPMMITALGGPFLGEWAGPRRWAAILIGFIGVIIVARPGTSMFSPPILLSIASAICLALYSLLTRRLSQIETNQSLNFLPGLFGSIIFLPLAATNWVLPQHPMLLIMLCTLGLFGMSGHYCLIKASTLTAASKISPFLYTQLIWMTLFGWLVFSDIPDFWTIIGATVICSSGLYLWFREAQIRRHQNKQ